PALDVSFPINALLVAYRLLNDLQIILCGAENQVEISERIDLAEVGSIGGDHVIISPAEHLGSAQRVLDALAKQPRERQAEKLVTQKIQEPHSAIFHRIH